MTVIYPADAAETRLAVQTLADFDGPAYLRFGRLPADIVCAGRPFTIGKANRMRDGDDLTIIACGLMVQEALAASDLLRVDGIGARVLDMHTIKPVDRDGIVEAAEETGCIVTVEEHNVIGGLGSAVAEVLVENRPAAEDQRERPVRKILKTNSAAGKIRSYHSLHRRKGARRPENESLRHPAPSFPERSLVQFYYIIQTLEAGSVK